YLDKRFRVSLAFLSEGVSLGGVVYRVIQRGIDKIFRSWTALCDEDDGCDGELNVPRSIKGTSTPLLPPVTIEAVFASGEVVLAARLR
uniref:Uncharacterized protein n=1 Tax=Anopheles atroparvus TaxID=41427 RepID=A0AAG5DL07_ANOAO